MSFTICEPLTNRPELIKVFREAKTLIREEVSKTDMGKVKRRLVASAVLLFASEFLLPFLFLKEFLNEFSIRSDLL